MRKFKFHSKLLAKIVTIVLGLGLIGGTFSCTEEIDDSNFAIKTEQTITDYLSTNDRYSGIKSIFDRVRLGSKSNASVLTSVLSSRGNYTIFVPSDSALNEYIKSLGKSSVEQLDSAEAELVAYSCIIDNKDVAAYETVDFPPDGSFANPNLNDRLLTCKSSGDEYIINGTSKVVLNHSDIELSNGYLHEVDKVISPSSDNLADMIAMAGNLKIFSHLLEITGWKDSLVQSRDTEYEKYDLMLTSPVAGIEDYKNRIFDIPQRRYIGFTALVETDDVFQSKWGITLQKDSEGNVTNWDEVDRQLNDKCSLMFKGESTSSNLKDADNPINRFVGYHILDGKMAYNRLVRHYNQYNYKYTDKFNPQTTSYPVNVWAYYSTLGKYRRLIKITQVGDTGFEKDLDHKIYANRISIYDNGLDGEYTELGVENPGILINPTNGEYDNNAQNGFYFPLGGILDYGENTQKELGSERIRFDMASVMPEIASNNLRCAGYFYFQKSDYLKNILNATEGTKVTYLCAAYGDDYWLEYEGDEFIFTGLYDFVFRLPPVPADGTYEIRMGTTNNSVRGMAQIYFGDNPNDLQPVGLPFDLRVAGVKNPEIAQVWVDDEGHTEAEILACDKNLRNLGYMKGPKYAIRTGGSSTETFREGVSDGAKGGAARKIITTAYMSKDKTYYLRFKTALKKTNSQFYVDYFEFTPTSVYAGAQPEDIW